MSSFIQPINGSRQLTLQSQEAKGTQENDRYYQPTSFAIPQGRPKRKQPNDPSTLISKLVSPFSKRPSGKISSFPSSSSITVEGLHPSTVEQNAIAAAIKAAEAGEAIATRHLHQHPYPRQRNFCPLVLVPISTRPQEEILKRKREEETSATCLKYPEQLSSSSMPSKRSHPLLTQPQQPHPSLTLSQQVPSSRLSIQTLEQEVGPYLYNNRLAPHERKELSTLTICKAGLLFREQIELQEALGKKIPGKKKMIKELFAEIRTIPNFYHLNPEVVEKKEARILELANKLYRKW